MRKLYTIEHEISTDSGTIPFSLKLSLVPVTQLYPHEKVVSSLLKELKKEILEEQVLKDPILVDEKSFTVLDGMHRLQVAKKLGLDAIPCCLVDYESSFIKLGTWCRNLAFSEAKVEEGIKIITRFLDKHVRKFRLKNQIREIFQTKRKKWDILIVNSKGNTGFCGKFDDSDKIYWKFDAFEEKIESLNALQIHYEADKAVVKKLIEENKEDSVFIFPPLIAKETVLQYSKERRLLPPKTTRHVFPARPLAVDCPLSFLKGNKLEERNKNFTAHLLKKEIKEKKGETKIEGRYYEEPTIYVFQ